MAIDTAQKRFQMMRFGIGGVPYPTGSVDEVARATFLGNYYFLYVAPVITVPASRTYYVPAEDRTFYVRGESRTMILPGENRVNLLNGETRSAVENAIS